VSTQWHLTEADLAEYLASVGIIPHGAAVQVEPAGAGNINWVRRVRSLGDGASWVVKQARPTLERFPEYRAPTERAVFEARYFETVAPFDRDGVCIGVVFFDERERILVLEDLGDAALGTFLGAVHAGTRGRSLAGRFENDAMRRLHGDHVFQLPYRPNDFTLSPAVAARADALRQDRSLIETIDAAYERYLRPEGALIHADVQPDNVLLTPRGPRLLDAEIAQVGDPAFDMGILVAHLLLPAVARGDESSAPIGETWSAYARAHGARGLARFRDVARYAGIELLRRTIGAARVAAVDRDAAALDVIEAGIRLVTTPPDALGRG
jgi:5-methylthioribose kinase